MRLNISHFVEFVQVDYESVADHLMDCFVIAKGTIVASDDAGVRPQGDFYN